MTADVTTPVNNGRARLDLFLISLLILFLELACIRWFPAHVLFLTFFTNVVLLACFLGMSLGCLAASHQRNYLAWTPYLLFLALAIGRAVDLLHGQLYHYVDVNARSPQMIFFGTEYHASETQIPMEVFMGFFFVLIALTMVGPGQELGRALNRLPNRVQAYSVNIFGSLVGIVLFAGFSWLQLPPFWWFLSVSVIIGYLLVSAGLLPGRRERLPALTLLAAALVVVALPSGVKNIETYWSPYYRINYEVPDRYIEVNLIGHQAMNSHNSPWPHYALPYLLNRDSGNPPFKNVLIIGAGSGNDVSRALLWGAEHVDAVEIDPRIQQLGKEHHPDNPYQDPRVEVHINDGRNFLRSTERKYDLVIYALVDSLVLHSGYSNIRLESYLFTQQAFHDVRRCLNPDGLFVMYNFFRKGWLMSRLEHGLGEVFPDPLVLLMDLNGQPHERFEPESDASSIITLFLAGNTGPIRKAFATHRTYWFEPDKAPLPTFSRNGFTQPATAEELATATGTTQKHWWQFRLATIVPPETPLRLATDDWPFLYLYQPMVPFRPSLTGAAAMLVLSLALLVFFLPRSATGSRRLGFDGRMFFLGAGFMLIETKAVVHMALLFGSTWMVNSIVFFAVLVMILVANLFVLSVKPAKVWPYYVGLCVALAANALIPLDYFLGKDAVQQVVGSCLLVFAPVLFAGVIFAVSFARTAEADRAFGANIAGAMVGGLAEYASMLLGFQNLMLLAIVLYVLSMFGGSRGAAVLEGEPKQPEPVGASL